MRKIGLDNGYWRDDSRYLRVWTSGVNTAGQFTYIWAEWSSVDDARLDYRIVQDAMEITPWSAFTDANAVFAKTRFLEEGDSGYDTPPPLGGAEILAAAGME